MTATASIGLPSAAVAGISAPLLQRTEWPVRLSIRAYGVQVGIRIGDPEVLEELARHLPPGSEVVQPSENERTYSFAVEYIGRSGHQQKALYVDDALLARRSTLQGVLRAFESDVQLHVAEMAPERVFVHAGVVGFQGRAILLPGRSFAGKSTLVAELVRAGAEYYSDEYAVLDSRGSVHPYPRPISIRQKEISGVTRQRLLPENGGVGSAPLPVGLIVLSKFRSSGQWRPRRLSPGLGILELLANTVAARRIPEIAMATLHRVVTRAPIIASERGEASDVVEPMLELAKQA